MAKFRIGDKVSLVDDMTVGNVYDGISYLDGMRQLIGAVGVVTEADSINHYRVEFEGKFKGKFPGGLYFSEIMLKMIEPKLAAGDRVKLRDDLEVEEMYDGIQFLRQMARFTGRVGTVLEFSKIGSPVVNFGSDDDNNFYYRACMLERVDKEENSMVEKIKNGSLVRMKNGKYYIALIGGVYETPGVLHSISDDDVWDLSDSDTPDEIFAVYEANRPIWGICEMMEVATGKEEVSEYFHVVYQKPEVKEMTVAEIEKLLGYPVKIVKEDK